MRGNLVKKLCDLSAERLYFSLQLLAQKQTQCSQLIFRHWHGAHGKLLSKQNQQEIIRLSPGDGTLGLATTEFGDMSRAAKSLVVFGIYLCGLGLVLLLTPNLLLRVFGVPPTKEVWIRINGMFVLCLSFFYVQAARNELTTFIRWTVPARVAVIIYFTGFVLLVSAPRALLLFGLIDLSAAVWTWLALRKDEGR